MKIGLQSWGSTGDINPFLALAAALAAAGHSVTLAITSTERRDYALGKHSNKGPDSNYVLQRSGRVLWVNCGVGKQFEPGPFNPGPFNPRNRYDL